VTDHLGDESLEAIDCTGTDNQTTRRLENTTYTVNTKLKQKAALAHKINYTPTWYAFYNLWPR